MGINDMMMMMTMMNRVMQDIQMIHMESITVNKLWQFWLKHKEGFIMRISITSSRNLQVVSSHKCENKRHSGARTRVCHARKLYISLQSLQKMLYKLSQLVCCCLFFYVCYVMWSGSTFSLWMATIPHRVSQYYDRWPTLLTVCWG